MHKVWVVLGSLDYGEATEVVAVFAFEKDAKDASETLNTRAQERERDDFRYRVEGPIAFL